jgi:hypothetical protein
MGVEYNHFGEECKSSKQEKERKFIWVEGAKLDNSCFCMESSFYMDIFGQQESLSVEA